jgi:serine/threonine-protein kinase
MKLRAYAVALAVALAPLPLARAQSPDDKAAADRLFNDAKALMQKKDYEAACPKFAESLRLDPGVGVMLYLADCSEKQGRLASAWATFREAGDLAERQGDAKRAEVARKHATALEPKLSTLTITLAPSADVPGLSVTRNGSLVGKAQLGVALPVDPGPHVIAATAPDRKRWETTTNVPGDHARVNVTVPALDPLPVPTPSASATAAPVPSATSSTAPSSSIAPHPSASADLGPAPPLGGQRMAALAVGAVGVVGVGIGSYFGLRAASKNSDSHAAGNCNGDNCTPDGAQVRTDAQHAATISTIAFIAGAAALAGGVVLWFTAPKPELPTVGIGGYTTGRDSGIVVKGSF